MDNAQLRTQLREMLAALESDDAGAGRTLNDLFDYWLASAKLKPVTLTDYERKLNTHVRPTLGEMLLRDLEPVHLQELYNDLQAQGLTRTPHYVHRLLHRALKLAVRWGWIDRNPATRTLPPTWTPPEREIWDVDELQTFLEATEEHELYPLWLLIITTGLRISEVMGLQWYDVVLGENTGRLTVERTRSRTGDVQPPKTKAGNRTITLSSEAVDALRRQRRQQEVWDAPDGPDAGRRVRMEFGEWVFTDPSGEPISYSRTAQVTRRVIKSLAPRVSYCTLHDMRHLHITLLLAKGVPVPTVAKRAGHTNSQITMSTYAHALPSEDERAAEAISAVLSR